MIEALITKLEKKLADLREYKICMDKTHCEYNDGDLELVYQIAIMALKGHELDGLEGIE